jgi:hypothetical protein
VWVKKENNNISLLKQQKLLKQELKLQKSILKEERLVIEREMLKELDLEKSFREKLKTAREDIILRTVFNLSTKIYKISLIHYNFYKLVLASSGYDFKYLKLTNFGNDEEICNIRNLMDKICDEIYQKELEECKKLGMTEILYVKYRKNQINMERSSKILREHGPEIYKIILSYERLYPSKRKELCINKDITQYVNKLPIYIKYYYGRSIKCVNDCDNKIYVDYDTVFASYIHMNMKDKYNKNYLPCMPKCPRCMNLYIRTPNNFDQELLMWSECDSCNKFFISDFIGEHLNCNDCMNNVGPMSEIIYITDSNFIYHQ